MSRLDPDFRRDDVSGGSQMIMRQPLSNLSRVLVLIVALLLAGVYVVPLWSIHLTAPQYPEGLGIHIWVHRILGWSEFDLQNINLLNHYIGMAPISAATIPELKLMPYILAYTIMGALATLFYSKRGMIYLGLINLAILGVVGLYDFWKWEHEYGHTLNPDAPIKIPGMVYQPPLIGCKQLLNITSCSWPDIGGYFLFISTLILIYIFYYERRRTHG